MKREINKVKPYQETPINKLVAVSSYFFPINSALFIEDLTLKEQFYVLNDRSQGGSAYSKGRLELMFHRFGTTNDELGMQEPMRDWTPDGKGINVSAKYWVGFSTNRDYLYRIIHKRHVLNQNHLQYFYANSFSVQQVIQKKQNAQQVLNEFNSYIGSREI